MKPGFYTIMAAQFLSSLADNALLIAAIALLREAQSADWLIPFLKLVFVVSYVMLAPFVGAFADSIPKGRVMFLTNAIKLVGCILLLGMLPPLMAYALVGFGAAAYSPAKYGILTELLPPDKLVAANGWIEGTTVASIILGTVLGGVLISPHVAPWLLSFDLPFIDTHIDTPAEAAVVVTIGIYALAAIFNLRIPDTGARYPGRTSNPFTLLRIFWHCNLTLWRDPLGQIALAVLVPIRVGVLSHYRLPFVDGMVSTRGSSSTAARRARARALNSASAMWWGSRPDSTRTCRQMPAW